jgi:hypothetical protein
MAQNIADSKIEARTAPLLTTRNSILVVDAVSETGRAYYSLGAPCGGSGVIV